MNFDISEFKKYVDEIIESRVLVLVEGKKDITALANLGIINVKSLNKPIYQIVEEIAKDHKECIILTDFDDKGKELYSKISIELQNFGVKLDNKFRNYLRRLKLSHIEGIDTFVEGKNGI